MATMEYQVRLDAFEGPLDLLLFLIRKAEVDITDIPIATITEQYLEYLTPKHGGRGGGGGGVEHIDIETAGEFLVMAATLMEIKSRMIAPPSATAASESGDEEGGRSGSGRDAAGDPRAELVRQLLEYKRYRDATTRLDELKHEWEQRFPSAPHAVIVPAAPASEDDSAVDDTPLELDDVSLVDLVEAFGRIIETVDFSRVGEHRVVLDETPVEEHADAIVANLAALRTDWEAAVATGANPATLAAIPGVVEGKLTFVSVFAGKNRAEMIGLFLAMLELVKQRRIAFSHAPAPAAGGTGELLLSLVDQEDEPMAVEHAAAEPEAE